MVSFFLHAYQSSGKMVSSSDSLVHSSSRDGLVSDSSAGVFGGSVWQMHAPCLYWLLSFFRTPALLKHAPHHLLGEINGAPKFECMSWGVEITSSLRQLTSLACAACSCFVSSGLMASTWSTCKGSRASSFFVKQKKQRGSGWNSLKWPCEYWLRTHHIIFGWLTSRNHVSVHWFLRLLFFQVQHQTGQGHG